MLILKENTNGKGLLVEQMDFSCTKPLVENLGAIKNYYITGIFMQSDVKNRNGRIYPKSIMEKEVARYVTEKVSTRRATGELDHPETIKINPYNVSHLITELKWEGRDVIGKALLLDTPTGKILKAFTDAGVNYGVSSRAMGSVVESYVQNDLYLQTVDAVLDPSAPKAFVNTVFEGVQWPKTGLITEEKFSAIKTSLDVLPKKGVEKHLLETWNLLLNEMTLVPTDDTAYSLSKHTVIDGSAQFWCYVDYQVEYNNAFVSDYHAYALRNERKKFSTVIKEGDMIILILDGGRDSLTISQKIWNEINKKYLCCAFDVNICFGDFDRATGEFHCNKIVNFNG
jgi:hypothetical protein